MPSGLAAVLTLAVLGLAACAGPDLDTRTFEVQYLPPHEVVDLIRPYVYEDRETNAGTLSVAEGAVTVRETPDNLEKIARVLEQYDRPRPMVVLHFQIIGANGDAESDPAIAEVEEELRRLFRFEGYDLVAETRIAAIQGTGTRQIVGEGSPRAPFFVETGISEVRRGGESTTVTLDVGLHADQVGRILETTVTIPTGHSVVLGTARAPVFEGALILVVRAELTESG